MRIGLVVDAGCDLPDEMIEAENVVVLPIAVRIGEHITNDTRNSDVTRQFLESEIAKDAAEAETIPYTVEQIRELFLSRLVHEYDYVFCQTIASTRSPIYERAVQASFGILNDYHAIREVGGNKTPFALRVQDTGNLFSGQALIAWDIEWIMPRPPELNACVAMYCAFIIPVRASRLRGSYTAVVRLSATSLVAYNALPSDGAKSSRETYGSEQCARTSKPQ